MTLLLLANGEPAVFQDLDPLETNVTFDAEGELTYTADLNPETAVTFTTDLQLTLTGLQFSTAITFACSLLLTLDVPVETPPVPVSAHRALGGKAFVMPTPTFDSRGRPKV